MKTVLLFIGLSGASVPTVQVNPQDSSNRSTPAPQPVPPCQRPVSLGRISPTSNFSDTCFERHGSLLSSNRGMPSGHAIAAFSVATIMARRYGSHRWVPDVSYGVAALVGFSRLTLSAHFASDVFVGGALGYSVIRFAVLQQ
jgi:membrane-associated phospholipid phosphatase